MLAGLLAAVTAGVMALAVARSGEAQTPGPSPLPTPARLCDTLGSHPGGDAIEIAPVRIALPPGGTYSVALTPPSPSLPRITVCYIEGDSSITLSALDCQELSREQRHPGAVSVLNAVRSSCSVTGNSPPSLARGVPSAPAQPSGRCPPGWPTAGGGEYGIDNITVTLPVVGAYTFLTSPPPSAGNRTLVVCYVEGNAVVQLSARDCRELTRDKVPREIDRVLSEIAASCRVSTGLAANRLPLPPIAIRPPDAGDAGLR